MVDVANSRLSWPTRTVPLIIETTTPTVNKLSFMLESYSDVFVNGPNDPMDDLGPLPMTARGNQYILVMSDHFTKWVEAVPMANQRAETV